ncbi:MAG: YfhO family protein, partial [Atopobiaceae bacterium]|nr:YfhO family protein [Atopobiaceae bacterium]
MSSAAAVLHRSRFWEYLLALTLPMVALCLAFAADGIFPFGQTSVCTADMDLQYVGLFGWLARVLHGEGSILYSMASGYGGNMLALVAYYLSSPLSAFLALFDYTQAAEYLSYATIAKIGLAGLAGYVFLRRRYGAGSVSVAFSIAYALGGYSLGQAGNIMWLDGVLMLPLVALGVHELVAHGRCWPLFVSVAVATFANWYTSYIDCLFAVIYFFVCRVECGRRPRDHFWRDGAPFAITMVLGLGASFVVMLPGLLDLTAGVESDLSFFRLLDPRFGVIPWQLPGYLACGSCGGWEGQVPYIATAGLVVVLAIARFVVVDERENARGRKMALGVMVALCLGGVLFINASVVWSAMRYASSFMFRHSYTVTFALVVCGREAWDLLREMEPQRRRHLLACCAL